MAILKLTFKLWFLLRAFHVFLCFLFCIRYFSIAFLSLSIISRFIIHYVGLYTDQIYHHFHPIIIILVYPIIGIIALITSNYNYLSQTLDNVDCQISDLETQSSQSRHCCCNLQHHLHSPSLLQPLHHPTITTYHQPLHHPTITTTINHYTIPLSPLPSTTTPSHYHHHHFHYTILLSPLPSTTTPSYYHHHHQPLHHLTITTYHQPLHHPTITTTINHYTIPLSPLPSTTTPSHYHHHHLPLHHPTITTTIYHYTILLSPPPSTTTPSHYHHHHLIYRSKYGRVNLPLLIPCDLKVEEGESERFGGSVHDTVELGIVRLIEVVKCW